MTTACNTVTEDSTSDSVPSGLEQPIEKETKESINSPISLRKMVEKAEKNEGKSCS